MDFFLESQEKTLQKIQDLYFELIDVTEGINSVALSYKSITNKKAIEVMFFNKEANVKRMYALYT